MIPRARCGFGELLESYIVKEREKASDECKFIVTDLNKKGGCGFTEHKHYSKIGAGSQISAGNNAAAVFH